MVEQAKERIESKLDLLLEGNANLNKRLGRMEIGVDGVSIRLARLEGRVESADVQLVAVERKLESLCERLDAGGGTPGREAELVPATHSKDFDDSTCAR